MDRENFNKCHDDNICNDFYVKNKEDAFYYGRLRGFYNYFLLLEDYKMEYIIGSACGTGIFLEDRSEERRVGKSVDIGGCGIIKKKIEKSIGVIHGSKC